MFTGIVETATEVLERTDTTLTLARPDFFDDVKMGASIAVSGVCLSAVRLTDTSMGFDVVPETWARTNLGNRKKGDRVNLERSLPASGRFEGHIVQGHIEGVGEVVSLAQDGKWVMLTIKVPEELRHLTVHKGSIAIDGVSLTIASLTHDGVTIALIPHTLKVTTLGVLQPGDHVNLETDVILRWLAQMHRGTQHA